MLSGLQAFHSKGNHKHNEETTYKMGENTTNDVTNKDLISGIQLNNNKNNKIQSKNGQN